MAESIKTVTEQNETWYFAPVRQEIITVVITGILFGVLVVLLGQVVDTFILKNIFCKASSSALCQDTASLSFNISLALASVGTIAVLAAQRIFRPALIVLPLIIILWSLPATNLFADLYRHPYEFGLYVSLISAAVMTSFYWLARISSFIYVAIAWLLLVLALRWFIL